MLLQSDDRNGNQGSACAKKTVPATPLVQIEGTVPIIDLVPSQFNARSIADDGTLVLYNSMLGSISGFPASARSQVEERLHKKGFRGRNEGITKYLYERGFLVPRGTDELQRVRMLYGTQQYRQDRQELILLASEECNFRCIYCYETFPRGTMEPWVRSAIAKMIETRAPRLREMDVSWFGGEPLLGYEAIEDLGPRFIEIAEKHGINFSSRITSNAYLLTPDKFENLLKWKVHNYQITLDGMQEDHDKHRILKGGGSTFETIFANLKEMKKFRQPFNVTLRINFDKENLPRIPDFVDLVKENFSSDERFVLRFYPIGKWGGANDDKLDVCGFQGEEVRQQLELQAIRKGVPTESKLPYMQPQMNLGVCYASRPYNLLIGADGKIMKCTIVLDTKEYNIIGHMTPEGLANIDIDKLAKWVAPYFEDDTTCRKCFYLPVCQGMSCTLHRIEEGMRPCPPEKVTVRNTLKTIWAAKKEAAHRVSAR
jgi:uncharacterized protein